MTEELKRNRKEYQKMKEDVMLKTNCALEEMDRISDEAVNYHLEEIYSRVEEIIDEEMDVCAKKLSFIEEKRQKLIKETELICSDIDFVMNNLTGNEEENVLDYEEAKRKNFKKRRKNESCSGKTGKWS